MKFIWKDGATMIDMERGEKLLVNHKGSVRFLEIEIDEVDDICTKSKENKHIIIQKKCANCNHPINQHDFSHSGECRHKDCNCKEYKEQ